MNVSQQVPISSSTTPLPSKVPDLNAHFKTPIIARMVTRSRQVTTAACAARICVTHCGPRSSSVRSHTSSTSPSWRCCGAALAPAAKTPAHRLLRPWGHGGVQAALCPAAAAAMHASALGRGPGWVRGAAIGNLPGRLGGRAQGGGFGVQQGHVRGIAGANPCAQIQVACACNRRPCTVIRVRRRCACACTDDACLQARRSWAHAATTGSACRFNACMFQVCGVRGPKG